VSPVAKFPRKNRRALEFRATGRSRPWETVRYQAFLAASRPVKAFRTGRRFRHNEADCYCDCGSSVPSIPP